MSKSKAGKENRRAQSPASYFAIKSQNEIYYQMASLFKVVNRDDDTLAKKILSSVLTHQQSEIFLENSL